MAIVSVTPLDASIFDVELGGTYTPLGEPLADALPHRSILGINVIQQPANGLNAAWDGTALRLFADQVEVPGSRFAPVAADRHHGIYRIQVVGF